MFEAGVRDYFNMSKQDWINRSASVEIRECLEESWVEKYLLFSKKSCVLDFACGHGRWVCKLEKQVAKIVAIDFCDQLIYSIKQQHYSNVEAFVGSSNLLSHYPSIFDVILFAQAAEFFSDEHLLDLFVKFKENLMPNGGLFISAWTPNLVRSFRDKHYLYPFDLKKGKSVKVFCQFRNQKELMAIVDRAGFKIYEKAELSQSINCVDVPMLNVFIAKKD